MDPQIATAFDCPNPPPIYWATGERGRDGGRIGRCFNTLHEAKSAAERWHGDGYDVTIKGPRGGVYQYVRKYHANGIQNVAGKFTGKYRWTK